MMKRIILASLVVLAFAATAMAQTGREIAQKVKDRPDGDTRQSELVMKLVNKRGAVRERKLISYSIDVGAGKKDRKSIMFFLYHGNFSLVCDFHQLVSDHTPYHLSHSLDGGYYGNGSGTQWIQCH